MGGGGSLSGRSIHRSSRYLVLRAPFEFSNMSHGNPHIPIVDLGVFEFSFLIIIYQRIRYCF